MTTASPAWRAGGDGQAARARASQAARGPAAPATASAAASPSAAGHAGLAPDSQAEPLIRRPATGAPRAGQRPADDPPSAAAPEGQRAAHGPPSPEARPGERTPRVATPILLASLVLLIAVIVGVAIGPAGLTLPQVAAALATKLPWHPHVAVSPLNAAIVWELRMPRVVLGVLVGCMLAGGGAAYQGIFRNPLADPYLLGVAAGGGLGATIVVVSGGSQALLPLAAFIGAAGAVTLTYLLGSSTGQAGESEAARSGTGSILLAGIAVAALLTAVQTYLQEQHTATLATVYSWILGGLSAATWSDVWLILPYVAVSAVALLVHRRLLDVLRVGETEATSLGVNVRRLRLLVVMAATLGVSAAVAVSGLIGFVGIIVPHAVRLTVGPSYRTLLPVSMIGGAAFLVLADVAARTVQAPDEVPIGVITALAGAPFFLFVLRSRRARQDLS